jgi:hypothetical protein
MFPGFSYGDGECRRVRHVCSRFALPMAAGTVAGGSFSLKTSLPLPREATGAHVFSQALGFASGANPFDLVTSNARAVHLIAPTGPAPVGFLATSRSLSDLPQRKYANRDSSSSSAEACSPPGGPAAAPGHGAQLPAGTIPNMGCGLSPGSGRGHVVLPGSRSFPKA